MSEHYDHSRNDETTPIVGYTAKNIELSVSTLTDNGCDDNNPVVQRIVNEPRKITPGTLSVTKRSRADEPTTPIANLAVKKKLFTADLATIPVTPVRKRAFENADSNPTRLRNPESPAKRRLFGSTYAEVPIPENVRAVYKIIRQRTGSIGGNGSFGPIYGELTTGSMQKMINLMKECANFNSTSRFIDVGSGIGKPNLHVSQDPGVEISIGIESEESRWLLGMNCLQGVLDSVDDQFDVKNSEEDPKKLSCNCYFIHGDILNVKTFNPFSHVYMFSIGFPPTLWIHLAEMWNSSQSQYLICYHGPRDIITSYEFDVELVSQTQTFMHGSKEGHMGYIYRRKITKEIMKEKLFCDPYFVVPIKIVNGGIPNLRQEISGVVNTMWDSSPSTRSGKRRAKKKV